MSASVGDIYEVVIPYTTSVGSAAINTFGFVCVTNVAGNAQDNLAAAFETALVKSSTGGLLFQMSSSYSIGTIEVHDVKPGTLATYERTITPVVGAVAGDVLPPQCAVVYSARTALKGRSYRGRFYLPGITEGQQAGGTIAAGNVAAFVSIATQLLAVFGPSGTNGDWRYAVISRFLNGAERGTPVATQVTSLAPDTTIRTQRRRVVGVGA